MGPIKQSNERVAPTPVLWPPKPLPLPSVTGSDGTAHDPTIKWPAAGGPDDATKPYRSLR